MQYLGSVDFGEYTPDLAGYNNPGSELIYNVIPSGDHYRPLKTLVGQTDAMGSRCLGAFAAKKSDGTIFNYAGTETKLYSSGAVAHTDATRSSGGDYSTPVNWSFAKWGDKIIATNYGDAPQIITMGSANFAALGGSPPKARYVAVVRNFVVLANLDESGTDYPTKVKWSGVENEAQWTISSVTQSDEQELFATAQNGGGPITGIVGGATGTIFQERAIWKMSYVGSPLVFRFDEIPGLGCPAPNSIVSYGDVIWFLGNDGFYEMRGGQLSTIGHNKVDRTFFDDMDTANMEYIIGAYDNINKIVIWIYPSTDSSEGVPDKALIYSWLDRKWSSASIACEWIYSGVSPTFTLEDLDTIDSDLDAHTVSFDSKTYQGGSLNLSAYTRDHKRGSFSGSSRIATLRTPLTQLSKLQKPPSDSTALVQGIRVITDATPYADCNALNSLETPETFEKLVSYGSVGPISAIAQTVIDSIISQYYKAANSMTKIIPFRKRGRYHSVQVVTNGDYTYIKGVDVFGRIKGRR